MTRARGAPPLSAKLADLRGRVATMEEMEENRFLLFTAAGVVCLLVAALGSVFVLSSSRLDPMDIPALYGLVAFFLGLGVALAWNGSRRGAEGRCLDDLRRQLAELEQAAFIDDVERLGERAGDPTPR